MAVRVEHTAQSQSQLLPLLDSRLALTPGCAVRCGSVWPCGWSCVAVTASCSFHLSPCLVRRVTHQLQVTQCSPRAVVSSSRWSAWAAGEPLRVTERPVRSTAEQSRGHERSLSSRARDAITALLLTAHHPACDASTASARPDESRACEFHQLHRRCLLLRSLLLFGALCFPAASPTSRWRCGCVDFLPRSAAVALPCSELRGAVFVWFLPPVVFVLFPWVCSSPICLFLCVCCCPCSRVSVRPRGAARCGLHQRLAVQCGAEQSAVILRRSRQQTQAYHLHTAAGAAHTRTQAAAAHHTTAAAAARAHHAPALAEAADC